MEPLLIVDRIQGEMAVCEQPDRSMVTIPLSSLPHPIAEGDCLVAGPHGGYQVDVPLTQQRRQQNQQLLDDLLGN